MKKSTKNIAMLCAFTAFATSAWATDYTSTVIANGTTVTLNDGDTITTTGNAIRVSNDGVVQLANLDSDRIAILNTGNNTLVSLDYGTMHLGSGGSSLTSNYIGVNINNGSTFTGANFSMTLGSESIFTSSVGRSFRLQNSSAANLGDNVNIKHYITLVSGDSKSVVATTNSTLTFTNGLKLEVIGNVENLDYGINSSAVSAQTGAQVDLGTNATVIFKEGRHAISAANDNTNVIIGNGSYIEGGFTGIIANTNASVTATGSNITANVSGVELGVAGTINLTDCNVLGGKYGIGFQNSATTEGLGASTLTVSGGTVYGKESAIGNNLPAEDKPLSTVSNIILKDGVQAGSEEGFLFNGLSEVAGSSVSVIVEGASTKAEGILRTGENLITSLTISDTATWSSTGASNMDNLILSDANVEFNMTSTADRITTGNLTLEGENAVLVGLTNDFLQEVVDLGLPQDFDVGIVKAFQDGDGNISYILATSNDSGSTWDIEDLGDGWFRIDNINIVPEPSTYAAVFGGLALAFAAYRKRRK